MFSFMPLRAFQKARLSQICEGSQPSVPCNLVRFTSVVNLFSSLAVSIGLNTADKVRAVADTVKRDVTWLSKGRRGALRLPLATFPPRGPYLAPLVSVVKVSFHRASFQVRGFSLTREKVR